MKLPFTNKQLAKIATFGAVFVAGNAVMMSYLVSRRFHQSDYFVNAASMVLNHKPLVKYLGEPISFGNPNLSDTVTNFSTDHQAQFQVPVKGSNTTGVMKFSAERTPAIDTSTGSEKPIWKITNLEVIVDDRPNEKIVIVRGSS